MRTIARKPYRELVRRLERIERDAADERLLQCLRQVGADRYETLLNRAGAIASALQRRHAPGSEIVAEYADPCEELLLQYGLQVVGLPEMDRLQAVTFRQR